MSAGTNTRAWAGSFLVLALSATGCPRTGGAPRPALAPGAPAAQGASPSGPNDAPAPSPEAPASRPTPTPLSAATPATPATPVPGARASLGGRLEQGTRLRPWPGVTLGLQSTESLPVGVGGARRMRRAATLALGIGQVHAPLEVWEGETLSLGAAALEVRRVGRDFLDYRWARAPQAADAPQLQPAAGARFALGGLYALPQGAVLGVGRILTLAKSDGSPARVLSLTLFPPNYERDPLQDYQAIPHLSVGKRVGGPGLRVELVALSPAGAEGRPWAELRFSD